MESSFSGAQPFSLSGPFLKSMPNKAFGSDSMASGVLEIKSKRKEGSESPIGHPNPSTEVVASSVGTDDLGGGIRAVDTTEVTGELYGRIRVVNWWPQLANRSRTLTWTPQSIQGLGPPISDPDPSTEVAGTHGGCWLPRWKGRGCQLAAPTRKSIGNSELEPPINLRIKVAD
ncbi:hypothetical protein CRG98_031579 [Punica granatum]|uniref:Uncharacterized protein n=1 Tax=Punica granatum TaxID=22663 RepID=A0A2I0IVN4_PUNGR|nr:hypothetical protein CRG98_031579 [Punica granatum]